MRRSAVPGMPRISLQHVVGVATVSFEIVAGHLNVNGRGQAEVQDLAHDVGGQERKSHSRKLVRQTEAQVVNIFVGRAMFRSRG